MIDELKAIAIFAETVKQGSFRRAAKVLGLSPSVISHHVSTLEKKVGTALIYRSTRKLSLTHEGEILYQHACSMLAEVQAGLNKVTPNVTKLIGKLTLSIPTALSRSFISSYFSSFSKLHPGIKLFIISTDERQNILEEGIDLAFRVGKMADSSLKSRQISQINRKLVCSPEYYDSHIKPQTPTDLSSWKWVTLAMLPNERILIGPKEQKVKVVTQSQIVVNSVELMTELCVNGSGLATPPDYLVSDALNKEDLIEVLPRWNVESIPLHIVWPNNVSRSSNTRYLINHIIDCIG